MITKQFKSDLAANNRAYTAYFKTPSKLFFIIRNYLDYLIQCNFSQINNNTIM